MDNVSVDFSEVAEGDISTGDFSATESLPVRKDSIEELCSHRNRALELYRRAYEMIEEARATHARACVGNSSISSFPHDRLRYYTAGEAGKFALEMQHIVDRDMWRAFVVGTPLGSLMDAQERKKFDEDLKGVPPEATPDNVFATMQRLAGEAPMIFRRGLVNAFAKLCRDYKSHDGFKIGDRIILTNVVVYERNCNWLRTGYRIEEDLKDVDRVMHVLDGKPAPEYQQGICSELRSAVSAWRSGGPMECETEYWKLKFFKNGNGHLLPKRKDLIQRANKLIAEHYGMVVGAAPDVATKQAPTRPASDNLSPDFYPTPAAIVAQMIEAADIQPGDRVLEPSAGEGAIASGIIAAGVIPDCIELVGSRVAHLYDELGIDPQHIIHADFLEVTPTPTYQKVLLNPPFSKSQGIFHVQHALKFLTPGGRLVGILDAGVTYRNDAPTVAFRNLIQTMRGSIKFLPENAFKESGTSVRTVMVTVNA